MRSLDLLKSLPPKIRRFPDCGQPPRLSFSSILVSIVNSSSSHRTEKKKTASSCKRLGVELDIVKSTTLTMVRDDDARSGRIAESQIRVYCDRIGPEKSGVCSTERVPCVMQLVGGMNKSCYLCNIHFMVATALWKVSVRQFGFG